MKRLFPAQLDRHQISFALGESLAHLQHLQALGRVSRERANGGAERQRRG